MKLRKKYTKKNKRTRKKRGGQRTKFDKYKNNAKILLKKIELDNEHKKLVGII